MLKNMTVLFYAYFLSISLNVLTPTFFNICNLLFLSSPNIGKLRVKVGPKLTIFPTLRASAPTELQFSIIFLLICSKPRHKQNSARDFFPFEYFLNNQRLTIFMETTLSKLVELLL